MRFKFRPVLLGSACALVLSGAVAGIGVTVVHAATPAVTSLSAAPAGGWTSEGGNSLTITGSGFATGPGNATSIQFGPGANPVTSACPVTGTGSGGCFTVVNDTTITATTPGHPQTALPADVTVTTPGGTSPPVTADHITFTASVPKAATLSIHSGPPGASITISPFDGMQELSAYDFATSVDFVPASGPAVHVTTGYTFAADLIKLSAPSSGISFNTVYDVTVTTAGGTSGF